MTYEELIKRTSIQIKDMNVIKDLVTFHAKLSREQLLHVMESTIDFDINTYTQDVIRYLSGTPIQHITGVVYFRGITIHLDHSSAFIPRFETEQLIDHVIEYKEKLFNTNELDICDIGTGTGVIPIALAKEIPGANLYATELNKQSVPVARKNFKENNTKVNLFVGDALAPLIKRNIKVDILVSNPPYIPITRLLDKRVSKHEPHMALFSGERGLDMFNKMFHDAKKILKDKYLMCFEHDDSHKLELEVLVKDNFPNAEYNFIDDLAGKPRFLIVWKG